jgi:hypothetical protein
LQMHSYIVYFIGFDVRLLQLQTSVWNWIALHKVKNSISCNLLFQYKVVAPAVFTFYVIHQFLVKNFFIYVLWCICPMQELLSHRNSRF